MPHEQALRYPDKHLTDSCPQEMERMSPPPAPGHQGTVTQHRGSRSREVLRTPKAGRCTVSVAEIESPVVPAGK